MLLSGTCHSRYNAAYNVVGVYFIVYIYSCLYHVHDFSPSLPYTNLLKSLHDVWCFPCQGFSSSSLLLLKCTSSSHSCEFPTKVSWIANFTPLDLSFHLLLNTWARNVLTCWHLAEVKPWLCKSWALVFLHEAMNLKLQQNAARMEHCVVFVSIKYIVKLTFNIKMIKNRWETNWHHSLFN